MFGSPFPNFDTKTPYQAFYEDAAKALKLPTTPFPGPGNLTFQVFNCEYNLQDIRQKTSAILEALQQQAIASGKQKSTAKQINELEKLLKDGTRLVAMQRDQVPELVKVFGSYENELHKNYWLTNDRKEVALLLLNCIERASQKTI